VKFKICCLYNHQSLVHVCTMYNVHRVSERTVKTFFCQNLVRFPSILLIFGTYM